jgi:hypothetical protein
MKRSHVYILCQLLGWYSHAAGNIVLTTLGSPITWEPVVLYLWGALAGILATHCLRAFIRRRHWLKLSPLRALPRVAAAALVAGIAGDRGLALHLRPGGAP